MVPHTISVLTERYQKGPAIGGQKMYIILLRHGDAEPGKADVPDENRRITPLGERALRAALPRTLELIPPDGAVEIWSSPMVRAQQTAGFVTDCLSRTPAAKRLAGNEPVICEELADSGTEALSAKVAEIMRETACGENGKDGDRTVILVGHVPQLERFASYLTGLNIKFKKGAAMCLQLDEKALPEGDSPEEDAKALSGCGSLRWFVQGAPLDRWKAILDLEEILSDGYRRVAGNMERFRGNPDDVEAVHDLRVSIRTLRSFVSYIGPFQRERQNRRMQHCLREIVAQLSLLREYDVLIEEVRKMTAEEEKGTDKPVSASKLEKALNKRRRRECRRVRNTFSSRRYLNYLSTAKKDFSNIRWRAGVEREGIGRKTLEARFDEIAAEFSGAYQNLDFSDVRMSHKVRKLAKKVRYVAIGMKDLAGEHREILTEMKKMQDVLGRLCDVRVNIRLLKDLCRKRGFSGTACRQAEEMIRMEHKEEGMMEEQMEKAREAE